MEDNMNIFHVFSDLEIKISQKLNNSMSEIINEVNTNLSRILKSILDEAEKLDFFLKQEIFLSKNNFMRPSNSNHDNSQKANIGNALRSSYKMFTKFF